MDHHAEHAHHSAPGAQHGPAFLAGIALNSAFVVVGVVVGIAAHSTALVADAGHNLGDVLGLVVAWVATVLARRPPTPTRSYGLKASSTLAALLNALGLLFVMGAIAWEAVGRLLQPEVVAGGTVAWVAAVGIVVNGTTAWMFRRGRDADLNLRGAFWHMAADAMISAGVVVGGVLIAATGWAWIDPVLSLVIVAVVLVGTWSLLRESVHLALQGTPPGIDPQAVRGHLQALPGVEEVHDLHIWAMGTTEVALTAHLRVPGGGDTDGLLAQIAAQLRTRFGIGHPTIQVERSGQFACHLAPDDVV